MRRATHTAFWLSVLATSALILGLTTAQGQGSDPGTGNSGTVDAALSARGKLIYDEGAVARNVTACAVCHGENGRGADVLGIPSITGQPSSYVLNMLRQYRSVPDFKLAWPNSMRIVTAGMTDAELEGVSAYVASMPVGEGK